MRKIILSLILALAAQFSLAAVPDSLKRDLEDYDYLVCFVEENYAPFDAIMQKGYKREYKALTSWTSQFESISDYLSDVAIRKDHRVRVNVCRGVSQKHIDRLEKLMREKGVLKYDLVKQ